MRKRCWFRTWYRARGDRTVSPVPGTEHVGADEMRGVTLIELVIVLVLVGIFAGGVAIFLVQGTDLWSKVTFQLDAMSQAELALDRMQREIAQIKDDSSVSTANATTLAFTTVNNESVQYQYTSSNATLNRNGQLLASGVQSATFQYWNVKGQSIASPQVVPPATKTDLWRIGLTMTVTSNQETVTLSTQMLPRNFFRANK